MPRPVQMAVVVGGAGLVLVLLALWPARQNKAPQASEPEASHTRIATDAVASQQRGSGTERATASAVLSGPSDAGIGVEDAAVSEEERRQAHEARRAARAQARDRWNERKAARSEAKRAKILAQAADDPEKLRHWQARFRKRDAHLERRAERIAKREAEREGRAAKPRPKPSSPAPGFEPPVLGPPVIGADGVAYDPSARPRPAAD